MINWINMIQTYVVLRNIQVILKSSIIDIIFLIYLSMSFKNISKG